MDILLQASLAAMSVCGAAVAMWRAARKTGRSIEAGAVSRGWLAEYRVKRKDWMA